MKIEHRDCIEVRAEGRRLVGLAAPFNVETRIGMGRERIAPGAFRASLASGADILALVDHDPRALLARTKSGSLKLEETSRGLTFSIEVPDTTLGADVLELAKRGDLGGASIGFRATDERMEGRVRVLSGIDLREVSIVHSWPAYPTTKVEARRAVPPALLARRRFLDAT